MGDDAEFYIDQQEEEARHQEMLRQAREDEIRRANLKRERAFESESKLPAKK
mgnify:CR=1 FL=1